MEGAVKYGLTATLHGDLDQQAGAFKQSNFHDYPILRTQEAPAVASVVFKATGQRLRSLPLRLT